MKTVAEPLTESEVDTWLNATAQKLTEALPGTERDQVAEEMRTELGVTAPFRLLASLSLLADCLRVAHMAIEADGQIEAEENLRVRPLVAVAGARYFQVGYEPFTDATVPEKELADFLRLHRQDKGPFGNDSTVLWRGLLLCKRIADLAQNESIVRDHERMLVRIMETVFAGRDTSAEQTAHRRLRKLFDWKTDAGRDPRMTAFCRPDGPEVFSSVSHGSQVFERDPFDVDSIHADARAVFLSQVERAIAQGERASDHGRTLLVLGGAGSGKTHLLRAFRTSVHCLGLGYVGYLQMSSDVGDYSRYVLTKLIDSLERPYDPPSISQSALLCLSDALSEHAGVLPKESLERLRSGEIANADMTTFVGELVDKMSRVPALGAADSDLLQALILLQRRDSAIQRRIVKFLRCESLTSYEQQLLGGLAPRLQPEDPTRMIEQIGKLAYALEQKALVLLVDQIEDAIPDATGQERIQRAFDAVRRIADSVPSSVIVLACLDDVYERIRTQLVKSVLDRLERDPPPQRLVAVRSRDEVERVLVTRLEHLYESLDVSLRAEEPLFPFTSDHLDELTNQQARDCLAFFHKYQESCIRAGTAVAAPLVGEVKTERALEAQPVTPATDFDRAWSDALVESINPPEDDVDLLRVIDKGIRACGDETGIELTATVVGRPEGRLTLDFKNRALPRRVIEMCNRKAQGGHLAAQIETLHQSVKTGQMAVALRTSEFSFGPKTAIARAVGQLIKGGGVAVVVEDSELRAIIAFDRFAAEHALTPGFVDWRKRARPLAQLTLFRKLLDLDAPATVAPLAIVPAVEAKPASEPPRPHQPAAKPCAAPTGQVRLGTTPTMRADAVTLDVEAFKVHAAFLGGTGSGKTTLALNTIEQLLEQGVSALLIDRKGDLARYASPAWWDEVPADPDAARRKAALRARLDVDLYTPGDASGRPLRLPLIPPGMSEMNSQERDQVAKIAAGGLAAMLEYGKGEAHRSREGILKKAIELHADSGPATLRDLQDTISRPDPELIAQVGNLTRHFSRLAEDLDLLAIRRGSLLSGEGEVLDLNTLLTPRAGRTRLVIISAVALTEASVLQFWVSRLLVELGRLVRRNPSPTLRAVAFFDEADLYIPAVSSPPTKEPMFDLLRRARSGGVGILLASQNTGDFDYKARDNINTWFIGKIAQDRAIEKMRNLLGSYPNVATRLASQGTGSFFLLNSTLVPPAREMRADRSLMKTEQLAEHEIAVLARAGKRDAPAPAQRAGAPARTRAA